MSGLTVLVLLLALQPPMGTVRGVVADGATGAPLGRVLVSVEGTDVSTQTDPGGRFKLRAPHGAARLFVSVVGYALLRREIVVSAIPVELTIALSEGTGTYTESVTVAADRFIGAESAVAAQHLLGSADLQNLRGVLADDPLRAVQVLPGVVSGDDLRSDFTVRASPFSHINMTVDGFSTPYILHTVRAVEDYSASGSVAMINSDILQDVALLSGGYPQRFGNRTGAEIDFRLREGSRDRTHALVAVSGTNASAVFEGPIASPVGPSTASSTSATRSISTGRSGSRTGSASARKPGSERTSRRPDTSPISTGSSSSRRRATSCACPCMRESTPARTGPSTGLAAG